VTRKIDCEVFQDQLDALAQGTLSEEGIAKLRLHAGSCRDCAVLLRMREHLEGLSAVASEAAVPDGWVSSMWPRVQAEVATRESCRLQRSLRRRWSWPVPAMAAATLLLAIASGLLFAELRRLRDREQILVQQVQDQQRWLAELDVRTSASAVARTAGLAGTSIWERVLANRESISVSELSGLLAGLPPSTTLLSAAELRELIRRVPYLRTGVWETVLTEIQAEDGLQAGEALRLIEVLGLPVDRSISMARVLNLSRLSAPQG